MANLLNPTLIVVGTSEDQLLRNALAGVDDIPVRWVDEAVVAELDAHLTCSDRGTPLVPLGIVGSLDGGEWVLNSIVRRVAQFWTGVPLAVTARRRGGHLELLLDEMGYGAPTIVESEEAITSRVSKWDGFRRDERNVAEQVAAAYGFTARREQVCVAINYGCRRNHLPTALSIGEATVATHLGEIYSATGARNFEGVVGLLRHAERRHRGRISARRRDE